MTQENQQQQQQHSADAAGGEAIYSSDGLSSIPIPLPPPIISQRRNNGDGDDDALLDTETKMDTIQAFEVFSGKVYRPSSSSNSNNNNYHNRGKESKLQRLARIQAELEELEADEQDFLSLNDAKGGGEGEVLDVVKDLSDRLNVIKSGSSANTTTKRQMDLTVMMNNLTTIESKSGSGSSSDGTKITTTAGITSEERLLRIEKYLGCQINSSGTTSISSSILTRLKQAEDKLNSVDEKTLNQASSRAKVIRADLEAAAKARSKLNNTNAEDVAKIAKLHDQLVDLDGFISSPSSSNMLSTIVDRLTTCASLHQSSMEFGNHLNLLEGAVKDVEGLLGSVQEGMEKLESGLSENMKVIQKNMETLDQSLSS